jgi:hypothetical protein
MWARRAQTLMFLVAGAAAGYFLAAARSAPSAAPPNVAEDPPVCCRTDLRAELLLQHSDQAAAQPIDGAGDR